MPRRDITWRVLVALYREGEGGTTAGGDIDVEPLTIHRDVIFPHEIWVM
jgi:hypothetical protein